MSRFWIFCGALLGAAGVGLAAYGAHGLEGLLKKRMEAHAVPASEQPAVLATKLSNFDTAVRWQMYHVPALILAGMAAAKRSFMGHLAALFFLAGIVLFSGLMIAQVFDYQPLHKYLIPGGAIGLMAGWLCLAFAGCCSGAGDD